mmetsp:Transcript_4360/g.18465  ORF Transcript_4360/g.18465 Transcript_4360/m.18465 type:complete len:495 (-) Transcript_4360:1101-2585(-)
MLPARGVGLGGTGAGALPPPRASGLDIRAGACSAWPATRPACTCGPRGADASGRATAGWLVCLRPGPARVATDSLRSRSATDARRPARLDLTCRRLQRPRAGPGPAPSRALQSAASPTLRATSLLPPPPSAASGSLASTPRSTVRVRAHANTSVPTGKPPLTTTSSDTASGTALACSSPPQRTNGFDAITGPSTPSAGRSRQCSTATAVLVPSAYVTAASPNSAGTARAASPPHPHGRASRVWQPSTTAAATPSVAPRPSTAQRTAVSTASGAVVRHCGGTATDGDSSNTDSTPNTDATTEGTPGASVRDTCTRACTLSTDHSASCNARPAARRAAPPSHAQRGTSPPRLASSRDTLALADSAAASPCSPCSPAAASADRRSASRLSCAGAKHCISPNSARPDPHRPAARPPYSSTGITSSSAGVPDGHRSHPTTEWEKNPDSHCAHARPVKPSPQVLRASAPLQPGQRRSAGGAHRSTAPESSSADQNPGNGW